MEKNKQTTIVFKPELVERLKQMKCKISGILLDILTTKKDIKKLLNESYPNFIQINKDNSISSITNKKAEESLYILKRDIGETNLTENWYKLCYTKNRQNLRPAKFVSNLFNTDGLINYGITEKDLQEFTQEWGKFFKDDKEFHIVKGQDIQFWYNNVNYARPGNEYNGSTLWRSCMADSSKNKFMELYSINAQFSLLILKDSENKIWGRALTIEDGDLKVMDRVYYINEVILERFRDWARENNFIYKFRQAHDSWNDWFVQEKDKEVQKKLELNFNITNLPKFNYYPYVDSFFYLFKDTMKMSNILKDSLGKRCLELRNPQGSFSERGWCEHNKTWYTWNEIRKCDITSLQYRYDQTTSFNNKTVYKDLVVASKILKRNILKTESIKVLFDNDWVTEEEVNFSKFHNGYILKNKSIPHPTDKGDFIHSDKMKYSEKYKKHILMDDYVIKTIEGIWMYQNDCVKINGIWFDKDDVCEIKDKETGKTLTVSKKHLDENRQLLKTRRSTYFEHEVINSFRNFYKQKEYKEITDLYQK
jgi:hypothetical protein